MKTKNFEDIWPVERNWLFFDVTSEFSEINDLSDDERSRFTDIAYGTYRLTCAEGLPCISIVHHCKKLQTFDPALPSELVAGGGMAPFSAINSKSLKEVITHLDQAYSHGMSSGFFCESKYAFPLKDSLLWKILNRRRYHVLVFGPESSGVIVNFINDLIPVADTVWIFSNGIRDQFRGKLSSVVQSLTFEQFRALDPYKRN